MSFATRAARPLVIGGLLLGLSATLSTVEAQTKGGRSRGIGEKQYATGVQEQKQQKPKKHQKVTTSQAVVVSRDILVKHGYSVVRVERVGLTQVIYYRRGNNGRGKGLGPMQKMVVRESGDRVVFESAPRGVVLDINIRLGL
jgi:hypothetical protein